MPSKRAKEFQKQFKQDAADAKAPIDNESGLVTESDYGEERNEPIGDTGPSFGVKAQARPQQSKGSNRPSVKKNLTQKPGAS